MVVSGEKERWLPTSAPFLRRVDLGLREIEIDWPADF
jgi:ribosomal 30S subunit maturation factor RimM